MKVKEHFKKYGKLVIEDRKQDWKFWSDGKEIMGGVFKAKRKCPL